MRSAHRRDSRPHSIETAGFTLMELMVVVSIIAILSTIAYGSYQRHVVKSRRAAAAACLQERVQRLERFHTAHMSYLDSSGKPPELAQCADGLAQHYQLSLSAVAARTFKLRAEPLGGQAEADARCGALMIDQRGVRSVSGAAAATPEECW